MSDDSRISPYSLADCKNTTDDALQNYLKSLKFQQSHYYTDVKLALGYSAVIISALTFAWDYKLGFEDTKLWTTIAVIAYFLLNGAFTAWIWAAEKGVIFTGTKNGKKLTITSTTNKNDPTYCLTIQSGDRWKAIDAPFMQWFTADGFFVAKPFQQWLASSVDIIGDADPKNLVTAPKVSVS
ncbi:hypothetical protein MBLNU459_g5505t1 [Dothideomycetes sp. NU459]